MRIPLRSLYVASRRVLISPVGGAAEHAILPTVEAIVAPSLLHHKHICESQRLAPYAALWAPPGFAEKEPELGEVNVLGRDPWPFGDELDFEVLDGAPKRNEVVFFHRASGTIYTADLVFNMHGDTGWLSKLTFRAMGVYQRFAMPRPWTHWVKNRGAFLESIERVLAWPFDRIVMAHGDVIETGGKQLLREALRERGLLPGG
ncbi:MAG: hypothetical protein JO257_22810 [Deltaproteobacteria bacterium]|nr:hypothetical protein [Deltaproteobacteria bacterium]